MPEDFAPGAPYFFLSYAHGRWYGGGDLATGDPWVNQFFANLSDRVRARMAVPPATAVGFMDREALLSGDWPTSLYGALATCRVFIPLYSPDYFESEHCGKEWAAFTQRLPDQEAVLSAAIIPAVWVPVEAEFRPEAARSIPCDDGGVQAYADLGFYGIIKLSRYRADYEAALADLADKVVDAALRSTIADGPVLDDTTVESAFGAAGAGMPGGQPLRITVAAPSADGLPAGRDSSYYGPAALDWDPYWPWSPRVLSAYVSDLARVVGYRPLVGDLLARGADLLDGERPSAPELLIVDPWAAVQYECREVLRRLDAMDAPWIQVVVPWNQQDAESMLAAAKLRTALDETLPRKLAEGTATSTLAVRGVPTLDDFTRVVPAVIRKAARQYHRYAPAYPPTGAAAERPRLSMYGHTLSAGE